MTLSEKNAPVERRVKAAALTAGLALTVTACWGGGGEPAESASPTGSPSTTTAAAESTQAASSSAAGSASASGGAYVPASSKGPARNVPVPQMPEEVRQETKAGAEAAVRYWWEAAYYLQRTNDPEPMLKVTSEECLVCTTYPQTIDDRYRSGGWYTGTEPKIRSILYHSTDSSVTHLVDMGEGQMYGPDGTPDPEAHTPATRNDPWIASVKFDDQENIWKVTELSYEGPES